MDRTASCTPTATVCRILLRSLLFFKELRPFRSFASLALAFALVALALGIPVVVEFVETGAVLRLPTAIVSVTLFVIAAIESTCGSSSIRSLEVVVR